MTKKREQKVKMTGAASTTTTRDPVKIVANIFISFIGAGVLGLPYAFKRVRKRKGGHWSEIDSWFVFRLESWRG